MLNFEILKQRVMKAQEDRLNLIYYKLTPEWFAGFVEAEGGFYTSSKGQPSFILTQHMSDWTLMEAICLFLGCGKVTPSIREDGRPLAVIQITNKDILYSKVVPLLEGRIYSLKKAEQFNLWKQTHWGLPRSKYLPLLKENLQWVAGFVDGDGSFYFTVHKAKDYKCGYQVKATFDIAQIDTEQELLAQISRVFFNGTHHWARSKNTQHMRIINLSALLNFVEPFFNENTLHSRKCLDFLMWQAVLNMMNRKDHLKENGIEVILKIRELQRLNRAFIHPSVLNVIMHLRPDLGVRLRDKDIVQTPTSDLS